MDLGYIMLYTPLKTPLFLFIRNIRDFKVILLKQDNLKIFKWNRYADSKCIKYFRLKNIKLTYKVKNNKLSSKLETRTSLKIIIVERVTIKIYLYNSIVNATTKVNQYTKFYKKKYFTVYKTV